MSQAIRTIIKIFLTILLVLSLIIFTLSLSVFQITYHKNLEPNMRVAVEKEISNRYNELTPQEIDDARNEVLTKCLGKEEAVISLTAAKASNDFVNETTINCSGINNETPTEKMIEVVSQGVVNSIYYKEYGCEFTSCISSDPLALISQKSNNYFKVIVILSGILLAALLLGIILLSKPKYTCFYNLSSAFIISGLLFLLKFILPPLINQFSIPESALSSTNYAINSIFINFLIVFILGIIFLALGIFFKIKNNKKK